LEVVLVHNQPEPPPKNGRDLRRLIAADSLVEDASNARQLAVVMLDACRDNPLTRSFARRTRSATGSGLADITAADGAYIAFATAPGNVAEDGRGANSPFTTAILRNIARPGSRSTA